MKKHASGQCSFVFILMGQYHRNALIQFYIAFLPGPAVFCKFQSYGSWLLSASSWRVHRLVAMLIDDPDCFGVRYGEPDVRGPVLGQDRIQRCPPHVMARLSLNLM